MNLGRKLSAEFCSHDSLDILHDARNQASVVRCAMLARLLGRRIPAIPLAALVGGRALKIPGAVFVCTAHANLQWSGTVELRL